MTETTRPRSERYAPVAMPETRMPLRSGVLESLVVFVLFFLFAYTPPPGVNEVSYLPEAKHFWNPSWCARDLFLQSGGTHVVFNGTLGWLTLLFPLETTAWIGRIATWAFLAWTWRRLSWAVLPVRWASVLSAGLFLLFAKRFHAAGEWVVGGMEAKGIAYGFIFLGLEALVRDRWKRMFVNLGLATAYHVILGGWTMLVSLGVWLALRRWGGWGDGRPVPATLAKPLCVAMAISLAGILPYLALNAGTPAETIAAADRVFVYVRVPHHLVASTFKPGHWMRHGVLLFGLFAVVGAVPRTTRVGRLVWVACGCALLSLAGVALDLAAPWIGRDLSAKFLRLFWHRLSDSLVPMALSLALVGWWMRWPSVRWRAAAGLLAAAAIAWNVGGRVVSRIVAAVPEAMDPWLRKEQEGGLAKGERVSHWINCTRWIRQNTDPEALFLTTDVLPGFAWYSERSEVASWKSDPKDARRLVEWEERMRSIHGEVRAHPRATGTAESRAVRWEQAARRYGADYLVTNRRNPPLPGWLAVYPPPGVFNPAFAVYRLPERLGP